MAKFYGTVGYIETKETSPDVWKEIPIERNYKGDVLRNIRQNNVGESVNDDLNINNQISIIADNYAEQNFFAMKYVVWGNVAWKIKNVEVKRPRLILTIGGVYNGIRPEAGTK